MAILRIAAAAGLLLVLAPEQTLRVAKGMVGMAEEAKSLQHASAETVMTYCRSNPQVCADAARQAAAATKPNKP
jgi:tRNA G18 (ribose-2'-O)-methylase SpoU